jgi:hypothetical protein
MSTIKISNLLEKTTDLKDEDITIISSTENSSLKSKKVSFIDIFDYIKTRLYGLDYVVKSVNNEKADDSGNVTITHVESADSAVSAENATKAQMLKDGKILGVSGAITG